MLFNSPQFVVFFAAVFGVYYVAPLRRFQVYVLVAASFLFYGWAWPKACLLLAFSILLNSVVSYHTTRGRHPRLFATLGVAVNLSILIAFKYKGLLTPLLPNPLSAHPQVAFWLSLPLPIGVSFFTFEGVSLLVDSFRREYVLPNSPTPFLRHGTHTALFIAFFPHLIAGPILKAKAFFPQIGPKSFRQIQWDLAFRQLVLGFFLKMVVADNLKEITAFLQPPFEGIPREALLAMLFAYSLQIFADFAGYSLIAMGLAELLGYRLVNNFDSPYISASFSEFWRRWHLSLSSWLKEYLYFPLGGNRKGQARTYLNLLIVMGLGGLWHGATWSYALWGLWHGGALAAERVVRSLGRWPTHSVLKAVRIGGVFICVTFAWLFFKLPHFSDVVSFYKALFAGSSGHGHLSYDYLALALYAIPVAAFHWPSLRGRSFQNWTSPWGYAAMIFALVLNSGFQGSFIYFRF